MDKLQKKDDENLPKLGTDINDVAALAVKNLLSTILPLWIPYIGPALSEMIVNFIPNQRMDRIENYFKIFAKKYEALDDNLKETIMNTLQEPESAPFVQKVLKMVDESESEQKRIYLASVLNNGLSIDNEANYRARLVKLVAELDELDILRLYGATIDHDFNEKEYSEFWDKYEETFYFEPEWDDGPESDRKEMISRLPTMKLISLGLLTDRNINAKATRMGMEVLRFIEADKNVQI